MSKQADNHERTGDWAQRILITASLLGWSALTGCTGQSSEPGSALADAGGGLVDAGQPAEPDHDHDAASVMHDADTSDTSEPPDGWWDERFARRRRLTLSANGSAEALLDLPVLVRLPAELVSHGDVHAEGRDLRFVDAQGTLLRHEIDTWTASEHTVWVRMPNSAALVETGIAMYYGAPEAESLPTEHAQSVWTEAFAGVWHFAGDARDATQHGYDGEPTEAAFDEGKIGQALALDREAQGYVRLAHDIAFVAGADGATVSAWVKHAGSGNGDQEIILGVGTDSADGHLSRISVALSPDLGLIGEINPDQAGWEVTESEADTVGKDSWRHVAVVMSVVDKSIALYVDGMLAAEPYHGSWNAEQFPSSPSNRVVIGGEEDASKSFFNGLIDELHVETTARTGAWVASAMRAGTGEVLVLGSEEAIDARRRGPAMPRFAPRNRPSSI